MKVTGFLGSVVELDDVRGVRDGDILVVRGEDGQPLGLGPDRLDVRGVVEDDDGAGAVACAHNVACAVPAIAVGYVVLVDWTAMARREFFAAQDRLFAARGAEMAAERAT